MSLINPDAIHVAEFPEHPEILPAHQLAVNFDPEELFIGQRSESKEECVFAIKWYKLYLFKIRKCRRYANLLGLKHANQHARFQYRVSYQKVWIAKQMTMEQFYRDFDASYNELQGWIAAIREYISGTIIELQTRPYYCPDDQL
ncbi:hypothetical protein GOBAR_AA13272 [Gossypium barbadense]|uniref:Uncharacterized protein n=1 Tax=Gossypium barbadense TaxID=3634 RepID=A0A2P5XVM7_GOSBA|nr:hypothetical protein GOBAR_AA13272 [Gossypium barbadense]